MIPQAQLTVAVAIQGIPEADRQLTRFDATLKALASSDPTVTLHAEVDKAGFEEFEALKALATKPVVCPLRFDLEEGGMREAFTTLAKIRAATEAPIVQHVHLEYDTSGLAEDAAAHGATNGGTETIPTPSQAEITRFNFADRQWELAHSNFWLLADARRASSLAALEQQSKGLTAPGGKFIPEATKPALAPNDNGDLSKEIAEGIAEGDNLSARTNGASPLEEAAIAKMVEGAANGAAEGTAAKEAAFLTAMAKAGRSGGELAPGEWAYSPAKGSNAYYNKYGYMSAMAPDNRYRLYGLGGEAGTENFGVAPGAPGGAGGKGGPGGVGGSGGGSGGFWGNFFGGGGGRSPFGRLLYGASRHPWWLGGGLTAGFGSLGAFAGFGPEHLAMTGIGIAGSAVGATGGAALLGLGALGQMGVGMGADMGVSASAVADTGQLYKSYEALQEAVAKYGKHSKQAAEAQKELNFLMKDTLSGTKGVTAELHVAERLSSLNKVWDQKTGPARIQFSNIANQGVDLAEQVLPKVAHFADQNLTIVNEGLKPLFKWIEGPEGMGIFDNLERKFKTTLPVAMHALDEGFQFFGKTINAVQKYTGGFVQEMNKLFTEANSPTGFANWEVLISHLILDFDAWKNLIVVLGRDLYDLFSQDAHTGRSIVEELTSMLSKLGEWERSVAGKSELHTIFVVHKEEILEIIKALGALSKSFGKIYLVVSPPLVRAATGIAEAFNKVLEVLEKIPGGDWLVTLTILTAKLKVLVPLIKGMMGLKVVSGVAGAAEGAAGAAYTRGSAAASVGNFLTSGGSSSREPSLLNPTGIGFGAGALGSRLSAIGARFNPANGSLILPATVLLSEIAVDGKVQEQVHKATGGGFLGKVGEFATLGPNALLHGAFGIPGIESLVGQAGKGVEKFGTLINDLGYNLKHLANGPGISLHIDKGTYEADLAALKGGTAASMKAIEHLYAQARTAISLSTKEGSSEAEIETLRAMKAEVKAVEAGVKAKVISQEEGQRIIAGITREEEKISGHSFGQMEHSAAILKQDWSASFASLATSASGSIESISGAVEQALKEFRPNSTLLGKFTPFQGSEGLGHPLNHKLHASEIAGHATGGYITKPTYMVGEEAPAHPEWVIATNPAYKAANVAYWAAAGRDLGIPGFAKGGSLHEPHIAGPAGALKEIGQGSIHKAFLAAQKYVSAHTPHGTGSAGGIGAGYSGPWVAVMHEIAKRLRWSVPAWMEVLADESGGRVNAQNPSSSAFGLGQLETAAQREFGGGPGSNGVEQIEAMAKYIKSRYGTPSAAAAHERAFHWYAKGGLATPQRVVDWAYHHLGQGPRPGYTPRDWCGDFLGEDFKLHEIGPPSDYPLASAWKGWGSTGNRGYGNVMVYGGTGHVALSIGGGKEISGNWGNRVATDVISGAGHPGPLVAMRHPAYTGSSGHGYQGASTPTIGNFPSLPNTPRGCRLEIKKRHEEIEREHKRHDRNPANERVIHANVNALRVRIGALHRQLNRLLIAKASKLPHFLGTERFAGHIPIYQKAYEAAQQRATQVVNLEPTEGNINAYIQGSEVPAYAAVLGAEATLRNSIIGAEFTAEGKIKGFEGQIYDIRALSKSNPKAFNQQRYKIPALEGAIKEVRQLFNPLTETGSLAESLSTMQGVGGSRNLFSSLPGYPTVGGFAGEIGETQNTIRELGLKLHEGEKAKREENEGLLREALTFANQRNLIAAAQAKVVPPFAGAFAEGGVMALTGETGPEIAEYPVGTRVRSAPETSSLLSPEVRVHVHGDIVSDHPDPVECFLNDKRVDAKILKVTGAAGRKQARGSNRRYAPAGVF